MASCGDLVTGIREFPVTSEGNTSSRQRGIALLVVLWLVALLALMAVSQSAAVRTETLVVGHLVESANARAAAYAGMQLAIAELEKPLPARDISSDLSVYSWNFSGAQIFITIADESGKVDLNAAPPALIEKLLATTGLDPQRREGLVDAIIDWRDRDDLRRLNGAEEEEYRLAGLEYTPRNGPFQSLEELALVIGMDTALYHTVAGNLTIYTGSADVNLQAASATLRQVLTDGVNPGEYEKSMYGTSLLIRPVASGGSIFTITVEALLDSGTRERLDAVVRLYPTRANAPLRYDFLHWREGGGQGREENE